MVKITLDDTVQVPVAIGVMSKLFAFVHDAQEVVLNLRGLLAESQSALVAHHDSRVACGWDGSCPVCSAGRHAGLFERLAEALQDAPGSPPAAG